MIVYIFILVLIVCSAYKYDIKGKEKGKIKAFNLLMFILFIMAGLRYHIGIDTMRYEHSFRKITPLFSLSKDLVDWEELSQPLWFFLNSFFRSISDQFVFVQLFHSAVIHILLGRFIIKTCKKRFLALGLFYCSSWWNFSFEIMRESMCVALYLNALLSLNNKDYKMYSFYALISIGIHWFAFVIFFITPFVYLCKRRLLYVIVIIAGLSIFYLDTAGIVNVINKLINLSEGDVSSRVALYLESDTQGAISVSLLGGLFIILTQAVYPVLISNQLSKINSHELFSKILLLYVIFVFLRIYILIFDRFCNYLVLILIVESVNVLADGTMYKMKNLKRLYLWFCVALLSYKGINTFVSPSSLEYRTYIKYDCRYIPYKTVFQETDKTREDLYNLYIY